MTTNVKVAKATTKKIIPITDSQTEIALENYCAIF